MTPLAPAKRQSRSFAPKFLKPTNSYCTGCPLEHRGSGFVPTYGSSLAPIMLVGESPWIDEMILGEPFAGAAGSMLQRLLRLIGRQREQYRIGNIVNCLVPDMKIDAWPGAVSQCRYLDDAINSHVPKVVVPMGGAALRRVLGLAKSKNVSVQNFHGTVQRDPTDRFWVVPTYHPSHLQRGATNLMNVVAFDLVRAGEVAERGWEADPGHLYLDPSPAWFRAWATEYIAAVRQDPYAYPLANDIETPEKGSDEAELATAEFTDASYKILRVNLSANPDEGITIPFEEPYLSILRDVYAAGGVQYLWFKGYDVPRLVAAKMPLRVDRCWDVMWMAKALQSDLPMGLGFWAPFYSRWGAWKHLAESKPVEYAGTDGLQTRRVGDGCVTDLVKAGQWSVFERHMHDFHRLVLQPATDIGVPIDRPRLAAFKAKLDTDASRLLDEIANTVPPDLCPRTPKDGLVRRPASTDHVKSRTHNLDGTLKQDQPDPLKMALYARATIVESLVLREVLLCRTCGKQEVSKTHRCERSLIEGIPDPRPILERDVVTVTRFFWQEPFNPDSPQQLLAYAAAKGHEPGKNKHTGAPSMDRTALEQLFHDTGDVTYKLTLDYRAVGKVRGTYVVGTEKRLDATDRLHPTFTFKPSTMRLSCVAPNVQNCVADKTGKESLAAGFRFTVLAKRESMIMEFDFAGIEAVILGWCMRDPSYMRLGKLGVHAYLASHVLKRPADLSWADADLRRYFQEIKSDPSIKRTYDGAKRVVHGNGYGQTPDGVFLNNRKLFATKKDAQALFDTFYSVCPSLPTFHAAVRHTAHIHKKLGGPPPYIYSLTNVDWNAPRVSGHPYAYIHHFHSVIAYERLSESQRLWRLKRKLPMNEVNGIWYGIKLGEDANRAVAFLPQSIARGVLTEACFPLFDPDDPLASQCYIGDVYYGDTPLRAPIHDSLLMEVPTRKVDMVTERVFLAMQRPIAALPCDPAWGFGDYLTIDVDGKIGPSWGEMESITRHTEVAMDVDPGPVEWTSEEADEVAELETEVRSA